MRIAFIDGPPHGREIRGVRAKDSIGSRPAAPGRRSAHAGQVDRELAHRPAVAVAHGEDDAPATVEVADREAVDAAGEVAAIDLAQRGALVLHEAGPDLPGPVGELRQIVAGGGPPRAAPAGPAAPPPRPRPGR